MTLRTNRFPVMLNDAEVNAIDDWRFANRIQTRSRAARNLMERGLAADELLEALRDCLGRFTEGFPQLADYPPIKRGYAAIAKAEGRS